MMEKFQTSSRSVFDPDKLNADLKALQAEQLEPDFYSDAKRVEESGRKVRSVEKKLETLKTLNLMFEDQLAMIELVEEFGDQDLEMELEDNDDYDNLVDKFLNSQPPEEQPKSLKIQSSGFDLKEAINPKQDLSEIMKAFDFYSTDEEE